MGKPIIGCGDATDTVVYFLCNIPEDWFFHYVRPLETLEMGRTDDSILDIQMSYAYAFGTRNPRRAAKLTGVTA